MGDSMTTTIGISEVKAKISDILKRALGGETFVVTNRGNTMAEITPPFEVRLQRTRKAFAKMRSRSGVRGKGMTTKEIVASIREGREDTAAARYTRKLFGEDSSES